MKARLTLIQIGAKLKQRKQFTVSSSSERNAALKAAQLLELKVTTKQTEGGFVIVPIQP